MTLVEFKSTLSSPSAPNNAGPLLTALWSDARGDWEKAHNIVQVIDHPDGAWIHAYLHRKEGDESNAGFWYNLAGRPFPKISLEEEWDQITAYFLQR